MEGAEMSLTLLEAAKAKLEGKRIIIREYSPHNTSFFDWDGEQWKYGWIASIAPEPKKKIVLREALFKSVNQGFYIGWRSEEAFIDPNLVKWLDTPAREIEVDDV